MRLTIEQKYNRMYGALKQIARVYQTREQLYKASEKEYGLQYEEALERAYDNIQQTAREAIRGIKPIIVSAPEAPDDKQ